MKGSLLLWLLLAVALIAINIVNNLKGRTDPLVPSQTIEATVDSSEVSAKVNIEPDQYIIQEPVRSEAVQEVEKKNMVKEQDLQVVYEQPLDSPILVR